MQSAFAYPQSYEQKPYLPWSGVCFGAEAAAGVAVPVHPQQQHAEQGLHSSSGLIQPITPQAGAVDVFNTYWQVSLRTGRYMGQHVCKHSDVQQHTQHTTHEDLHVGDKQKAMLCWTYNVYWLLQVAPGASSGEFGAVEDEQQTPEHAPPPKQVSCAASTAGQGVRCQQLCCFANMAFRCRLSHPAAACPHMVKFSWAYWHATCTTQIPAHYLLIWIALCMSITLQRKGANKAKKGSARRDLDKLAKQEQRMIKNRESAARSRLRRQQHTADLEQENEALRCQVADLTTQVRLQAASQPCVPSCMACHMLSELVLQGLWMVQYFLDSAAQHCHDWHDAIDDLIRRWWQQQKTCFMQPCCCWSVLQKSAWLRAAAAEGRREVPSTATHTQLRQH